MNETNSNQINSLISQDSLKYSRYDSMNGGHAQSNQYHLSPEAKTLAAFKRAVENAIKLSKDTSRGAKMLNKSYWGEVIHASHGYGLSLKKLIPIWKTSLSNDNFNTWVNKLEAGEHVEGKNLIDPILLKDGKLVIPHVIYLDKELRQSYKMQINDQGQIFTENAGVLFNTQDTYNHPHIFIVSPENEIYIGTYDRGTFNHSSFLAGGAVKSAGELIFSEGKIIELTDKSGHYRTDLMDMLKGIHAFIISGANLDNTRLLMDSMSNFSNYHPVREFYIEKLNNGFAHSILTEEEYNLFKKEYKPPQIKETIPIKPKLNPFDTFKRKAF